MARPIKDNAEYFSHDADMRNDPKIKALRSVFGTQGYAIWNMILEMLTDSDYFEYEWNEISQEIMAGDFGIPKDELIKIIDYCIKIKLLSVDLENEKLCCIKLKCRFTGLLNTRERKRNRVMDGYNTINNELKTDKITIVKESKVKNSIVKESTEKKTKEKNSEENLLIFGEENELIKLFDKARKMIPGSPGGLKSEFEYFKNKNKDWKTIIPLLVPAIDGEMQYRAFMKEKGKWVPEWKNFRSWLNQRRWEQEYFLENEQEKKSNNEIKMCV